MPWNFNPVFGHPAAIPIALPTCQCIFHAKCLLQCFRFQVSAPPNHLFCPTCSIDGMIPHDFINIPAGTTVQECLSIHASWDGPRRCLVVRITVRDPQPQPQPQPAELPSPPAPLANAPPANPAAAAAAYAEALQKEAREFILRPASLDNLAEAAAAEALLLLRKQK